MALHTSTYMPIKYEFEAHILYMIYMFLKIQQDLYLVLPTYQRAQRSPLGKQRKNPLSDFWTIIGAKSSLGLQGSL